MTHIEIHRTCEDREEWRRLAEKATSAATIDNDDIFSLI